MRWGNQTAWEKPPWDLPFFKNNLVDYCFLFTFGRECKSSLWQRWAIYLQRAAARGKVCIFVWQLCIMLAEGLCISWALILELWRLQRIFDAFWLICKSLMELKSILIWVCLQVYRFFFHIVCRKSHYSGMSKGILKVKG